MALYGAASAANVYYEDDDDDEEEDSIESHRPDKIRRNYLHQNQAADSSAQQQQANSGNEQRAKTSSMGSGNVLPEPIQVRLNESFLANERRAFVNLVANCRQRLSSMQLFNPAKNQTTRENQQQWSENEKYTLDSLNEIKGGLDEQFQWKRAEDRRELWGSKLQYLFALTSYSIGLGNVIRFPILVHKNGGLAFIIPFVIMLVVEGIPLFYLELAIGQRMRRGAISCWGLVSPFAAGIGLASAAVSFLVGLYYNTMVAWTLLYLWDAATQRPLPFTLCPAHESGAGGLAPNGAARSGGNISANSAETQAAGNSSEADECQAIGPFQHYWFRQTLDASPEAGLWWPLNWSVLLALIVAWTVSYLCLARGLASSKRVVYFTFAIPYVILTIFFFKATSLKGMGDGIYYLLEPEWSKLFDPYVWYQAAAQVFFSLGLGFGGLIALSSYNPVNNNCYRDAVRVSLVNFFTSLYAAVVIFAILGYKAHLSHDKCLGQREQAIDYYLSDYNLKVIDYGSMFKPADAEGTQNSHSSSGNNNNYKAEKQLQQELMEAAREATENITEPAKGEKEEDQGSWSEADEDYYDSADAIASIKSLDRLLIDSASDSKGGGEARLPDGQGASDTEFIIDLSSLIDKDQLDKVIADIPGLPKCNLRQELDESTKGTGLIFVVMAEAISQFQDAPLWAAGFFFMLLMFGLDSQFGNLEGLLSSVTDLSLANSVRRQWFTGLVCYLSLAISALLFAHGAGSYMSSILDDYVGNFSLVIIALFELIAISYLYGLKRFCDDCELMTGRRPPFIILLSWRYISPILLLIVICATLRNFFVSFTYEAWLGDHLETKAWPAWCVMLGACLILACVIWIPAIAMLKVFKINVLPEESLNECWFPAEELREFYDIQEEHKVTKLERVLFGFRSDDD